MKARRHGLGFAFSEVEHLKNRQCRIDHALNDFHKTFETERHTHRKAGGVLANEKATKIENDFSIIASDIGPPDTIYDVAQQRIDSR